VACACDFLCKSRVVRVVMVMCRVLTGSVAVAQGDPLDDLFVCGDGLFRLEEESHGM